VSGSCECSDETLESGAMELVSDKDVSKYRSIRSFNDWVWEKNIIYAQITSPKIGVKFCKSINCIIDRKGGGITTFSHGWDSTSLTPDRSLG
jgi:hypothetical protein